MGERFDFEKHGLPAPIGEYETSREGGSYHLVRVRDGVEIGRITVVEVMEPREMVFELGREPRTVLKIKPRGDVPWRDVMCIQEMCRTVPGRVTMNLEVAEPE